MRFRYVLLLALPLFSGGAFAYWAQLDYGMLVAGELSIRSTANKPIICKIRALDDVVHIQLVPEGMYTFKVEKGLQIHQISLFCNDIKRITRTHPYRKTNRRDGMTTHRIFLG